MRQGKIVDIYGNIFYYKDDQLHSENDLPAEEWTNGDKVWYQNGKLHRDNDLPAIISEGGTKCWYQNGLQHRVVGAAIIYADGEEFYYIEDEKLTKEEHANHPEVKKYKLQQILNRLTA